jgi:transcription elongation factor GreA
VKNIERKKEDYIMERQSPYKLTREGLNQLKWRLQKTEDKLAKLLSQKHEIATTQGDYWHDNPAFNQLEMDERALRLQIREIRNKLNHAVIIEKTEQEEGIQIGSFVTIIFEEDGREMELTIVDPETIDPSKGLISYVSPLGKTILGARVGDTRTYSVGERKFQIKIVKVVKKDGG